MALTLNPMGILQSAEVVQNLNGLTGIHNQTYDEILERGRKRYNRDANRSSGASARQRAVKKRRARLNQSHNGTMGSIKEGGLMQSENGA